MYDVKYWLNKKYWLQITNKCHIFALYLIRMIFEQIVKTLKIGKQINIYSVDTGSYQSAIVTLSIFPNNTYKIYGELLKNEDVCYYFHNLLNDESFIKNDHTNIFLQEEFMPFAKISYNKQTTEAIKIGGFLEYYLFVLHKGKFNKFYNISRSTIKSSIFKYPIFNEYLNEKIKQEIINRQKYTSKRDGKEFIKYYKIKDGKPILDENNNPIFISPSFVFIKEYHVKKCMELYFSIPKKYDKSLNIGSIIDKEKSRRELHTFQALSIIFTYFNNYFN